MAGWARLLILCGLPFAGKTTLARELARAHGFAHVALDAINEERGVWDPVRGLSPEQWAETYAESYRRLDRLLAEGRPVVYDATNFTRAPRDRPRAIAARHGAPANVLYVAVLEAEARRRWQHNRATGRRYDVRDEDFVTVADNFEPPVEDEAVIRYDGSLPLEEWARRVFG